MNRTTSLAAAYVLAAGSPVAAQVLFTLGAELGPLPAGQGVIEKGERNFSPFTSRGPAGWGVDNSAMAGFDVPEPDRDPEATFGKIDWFGWTIADQGWWTTVAGDQRRSDFTLSSGAAAIADPDEWDDSAHPAGTFNSVLESNFIDMTGFDGGSVTLTFDSSWRPYASQTAEVLALYSSDGGFTFGAVDTLFAISSDPLDVNFRDEAGGSTNETISVPVNVPAGTNSMIIGFKMSNAGNDWWWAVDNVLVQGTVSGAPATFLDEDFNSVTLGAPFGLNGDGLSYGEPYTVWSNTGPAGTTLTRSTPTGGVETWNGFVFSATAYWRNAGRGSRVDFTPVAGSALVADPELYAGTTGITGPFEAAFNVDIPLSPATAFDGDVSVSFDYALAGASSIVTIEAGFNGGAKSIVAVLDTTAGDILEAAANLAIDGPSDAASLQVTVTYSGVTGEGYGALANFTINGTLIPTEALDPRLFEDFERLTLGPVVDEARPIGGVTDPNAVWTNVAPAGLSVDNSQTAGLDSSETNRVDEFAGWTFLDKTFWVLTAGDQGRGLFELGTGTVAVADGDEWRDRAGDATTLITVLQTDVIDISAVADSEILISFDSSFRPYGTQAGIVSVSFDGNAPVELYRLDTASIGGDSVLDRANIREAITAERVGGESTVQFFLEYQGGNDWWWAIDNLAVSTASGTLYSEDFEGLPLGPVVDEAVPTGGVPNPDAVWTEVPPAGWTVDDSQLIDVGDDDLGVFEFEGVTFMNKNFWILTAGNQDRSSFTRGEGTVAIFDGDEWDDAPHSVPATGLFNAFLISPEVSLENLLPETAQLRMDSSFRPYETQTGIVEVSYDSGATFERVLELNTASSGGNSSLSRANEELIVPLDDTKSSVIVRFGMIDADNDWWWAFDNILIGGVFGGPICPADLAEPFTVIDIFDILKFFELFGAGDATADFTGDGMINVFDIIDFFNEFGAC